MLVGADGVHIHNASHCEADTGITRGKTQSLFFFFNCEVGTGITGAGANHFFFSIVKLVQVSLEPITVFFSKL
jgi:hypothetical protein